MSVSLTGDRSRRMPIPPTGAWPALAWAVGCLVGGGCIAVVPHAEPEVLAAARPLFPDYSADLLEVDRQLFVENCTGCHVLRPGKHLPVAEWPNVA